MEWTYDETLLFLKESLGDLSKEEIKCLIVYLKFYYKIKEMREKLK